MVVSYFVREDSIYLLENTNISRDNQVPIGQLSFDLLATSNIMLHFLIIDDRKLEKFEFRSECGQIFYNFSTVN